MKRVIVVLLSALLACPVFVAGAAAPPPASDVASQADVAGCVRSRHRLDLMLLMDTSESLEDTDPTFKRVTAARLAVDGLTRQLDSGGFGSDAVVEVTVAGFAGDLDDSRWLNLRDAPAQVVTEVETVGHRQDGKATDYVAALQGAERRLTEQAAAATSSGGEKPCQALLWFTDGKNQPDGTNTSKAATEEAVGELCRPDGVVDRLRATGAALLTVSLTGQILAGEQDFLREITGELPGCGTRASAGGSRFLSADENTLIYKIFEILDQPAPGVLCDGHGKPCAFTVDSAMSRFYVVVQTAGEVGEVSLVAPDGSSTLLTKPGSAQPRRVSGAMLSWQWFDGRTLRIDGQLPGGAVGEWAGAWQVVAPGGTADGRLYVYGSLDVRLAGVPHFVRGEPWRFGAKIAAAPDSANPGDLARLAPAFTATVSDGDQELQAAVSQQPGRPDIAQFSLNPPDSWRSAEVVLKVRLVLRTSSGIELSPPVLIERVPVDAPLLLKPTGLTGLPSVHGHGTTDGTITVEAKEGTGCFWLAGDAELNPMPATVASTTNHPEARGPGSCVPVRPGAPGKLTVRFTVEHSWTGTATGSVPLMVAKDGQAAVPYTIPVSFTMVEVTDREKLIWSVAGVLAATLSPLLLFLLVNWLGFTRFDRARDIRVRTLRIRVRPRGGDVHITAGHAGSDWATDALARPPGRAPRWRLAVDRLTFRARFSPRRPFAPPTTQVSADGPLLATPAAGPAPVLTGLPTYLPGTVVVVAEEPHASGFDATVVHVQNLEPFVGEAVERFRQAVHDAAARLATAAPEVTDPTHI
ncbi:vWA domain-containing protein [Amycolatopsis sp. NPDC049691]|uniref:vWA domain-containing protein n=1 Tax=Amycolatopsis sp. NPDC049691 TaxID=3155155 RepID=UPI003413E163